MGYELRINSDEFRSLDENSIQFKQVIQSMKDTLISPIVNSLEITTLNEICFTDDFATELNFICKKYNLPQDGFTNNEFGVTWGKAIRINDNPNFVVICRIELLENIYNNSPYAQGAVNLIHHELCHVSDYTKRHKFERKIDEIRGIRSAKMIGLYSSSILYSEYVVSRLCTSTMDTEISLKIQDALDYYVQMEEPTGKAIKLYLEDNDVMKLLNQIHPLCGQFMISCCYTIGYLHGGLNNPSDLTKSLSDKWNDTPFQEIWNDLETELNNLYILNNWENISVLDNLSAIYRRSLIMFGIELVDTKEGFHLRITR